MASRTLIPCHRRGVGWAEETVEEGRKVQRAGSPCILMAVRGYTRFTLLVSQVMAWYATLHSPLLRIWH